MILAEETVVLELPASAEHVGTARLFTAEAARFFGVDEETAADLKVAVSEACTGAVGSGDGEAPITISITPEGEAVNVEVSGPWGVNFRAGADLADSTGELQVQLGVELVRAMFPEAKFERSSDASSVLKLSLPISVEPEAQDS